MNPTEHGARCSEFNSYLAEGLHGSLDEKSCHVTWLRHCLNERGAAAMLDGRLMLDLIADHTFGASAAELQRREMAFKSKTYFKDSMSGPETRAAYTEFIADHRLLPDHAQGGPFQAHRDLISKLPPSCRALSEKYSRKMYQEQARRYSMPSISLKELLELAIVDILRSQGPGVNTLTPLEQHPDAVLAAGRDDRQRQRSGPARGGRSRACTICGEEGHNHMGCTKSCKACSSRRCPGAYGKPCAVHSKTRPYQLIDALGMQLSSEAYADLLAAWRQKNPREAEADLKARSVARDARRAVRCASGEQLDAESDGDDHHYEDYGVAALGVTPALSTSNAGRRAYDPCEDDSDSSEEHEVRAVSWHMPDASGHGGISAAVHTAQHQPEAQGSFMQASLLIDSGASIHLFQTDAMRKVATELVVNSSLGYINGVGGRSPVTAMLGAQLHLKGGVRLMLKAPFAAPSEGAGATAQDILSTGKLYDDTRIVTVLDPEPHLRTPEGTIVPLQRRGRYYMLEASIAPLPDAIAKMVYAASETSGDAVAPVGEAAASAAASGDENDMWAARLCLSSRGLKKLVQATTGHGIKAITHRMVVIADSDIFKAASNMRRQPVPRGHAREFLPGQCLEYDVWGPAGAASANGNERFDLHAVCVASGYSHACKRVNHIASTVVAFLSDVVAKERALGHSVLMFRMDRAPEHESQELQQGLRALGVHLELTPRNHHEGIGNAEGANDPTQRMAETSTRRAGLTLGFILDARIYAWLCRNLRCAAGRARTRHEEHTGVRPDFSRQPKPYLFGVKCLVLQEEAARGPKGSLFAPRSLEGTFVGIEGASYLVRLDNGAGLVRQRHIKVLNERALLVRGMPPGAISVDGSAQTEPQPTPSGPHQHTDVPRQSHFPAPMPSDVGAPPDMVGPPSMRTRAAQLRHQQIIAIVGSLEQAADGAEARSMLNAAVFQLAGDDLADALHCDEYGELDVAISALMREAHHPTQGALATKGIYKASQATVQVKTPLGLSEERVPATCKQVREHPKRLQWENADAKARDVLLRAGNKMVTLNDPEAEGAMIVRAVVQRKIKIDAATGAMATHDAYKSRICVDGRNHKLGMEAMGLSESRPTHATSCDDLTFKMLLAKVAHERGTMIKIDIVNAYAKGVRGADRKYVLIRMPETVRELDESGSELYMLGITPMQGEEPSGDEWWAHICATLRAAGAHQAESVGGFFSGKIDGSEFGVALVTDDLFVGEWGGADYLIGRRLGDQLKIKYKEIKYEEDPTSFTAYMIVYNRSLGCVSLYMTVKTLEAVHEYLPDLQQGVRPSAKLKKGETLERLADLLKLPPAEVRHAKLDKEQKQVQEIIGSVKFLERVRIDLSLAVHRLSCVMSYPPEGALLVAHLVLERAFDGRNTGITYGGVGDAADDSKNFDIHSGAPAGLQCVADATWGLPTDLYGIMMTYYGGAVFHQTKKINVVMQSSMETEGLATSKATEMAVYGREIAFALGIKLDGPTKCATDNTSNLQVSSGKGAANRTKYCIRRFLASRQRVTEGLVSLEHVKDVDNPADFLTKWLPAKKFKLSLAYATNSANAVKIPHKI